MNHRSPSPARPRAPLAHAAGAAGPLARRDPHPHTAAELAALIGMVTAPGHRVRAVVVGHGRDHASCAAAEAFTDTWAGSDEDRTVLAVVHWPETAASWLRNARRFAAHAPDAWVVAAAPAGFARLARRLQQATDWDPLRTFAFAALGTPATVALAAPDTVQGLRGASGDGGTWQIDRGRLIAFPPRGAQATA